MTMQLLPHASFQAFLDSLWSREYRVMGPRVMDGSVLWDEIRRVTDLPKGWRDRQEPGRYQIEPSGTNRLFDVVHGPESVKRFAFAPREPLLTIERRRDKVTVREQMPRREALAILGMRPCDLAGLAMQDRIFLRDAYADPYYGTRRQTLLTIVVNCTRAVSTCFCASMVTGPRAGSVFDLALTELEDGFLVEIGSEKGHEVLEGLPLAPASASHETAAREGVASCAESQERRLNTASLPQALYDAHEHPRWDDVASRCLSCTNCTMVCPTCFCHGVEETSDLSLTCTERSRVWDSCFTQDHGYIHGKNFRPTIKDRYRMWLTHKLATWIDQFGGSGCVGCGRCITWCPVGIDLTAELPALLNRP